MNKAEKPFHVYRSSAGSGKTYTLVKAYLKLCLKYDNPSYYKRILAITFTNAAAAEMKERVLKQLAEFDLDAETRGDHMPSKIAKELSIDLKILCERAKRTHKHLLHHYSDFRISTIDSFIHGVIRTFARDLQLDPEFDIEMDTKKVLRYVVDEIFDQVGQDKNLTPLVMEYVRKQLNDEKAWNIHESLVKFGEEVLNEQGQLELDKLRELQPKDYLQIRKNIVGTQKAYEKALEDVADKGLELIDSKGIDPGSFSRGMIPSHFKKFKAFAQAKRKDPITIGATIQKQLDGANMYPKAAPENDKVAIDGIRDELAGYVHQLDGLMNGEEFADYKRRELILKELYNNALLSRIEQGIGLYKEEYKAVLISDFNHMIHRVVRNNPTPFIYEKIGERFNHILIDEFQDTSSLQWQNFLPLIDHSLSRNHFNLVVGDAKQAIYRWRNGNAEQFTSLPEIPFEKDIELQSFEDTLTRNFFDDELNTNYRSSKAVVHFNNYLYARLGQDFPKYYGGKPQEPSRDVEGYVQVSFIEGKNKADRQEAYDNFVLSSIDDCLNDGYLLEDITLLVRRKKEGRELAALLQGKDIEVTSSESLLIKNNPGVGLVVNLLNFFHDSSDEKSKLNALKSLVVLGLESDLKQLVTSYTQFKDKKSVIQLDKYLRDHHSEWPIHMQQSKSLYSLAESIMREFKLGDKANTYLDSLLSLLYKMSEVKREGLADFVRFWEDKKDSLTVQSGDLGKGIRIMTIHQSKGLQFPVVIFPLQASSARNTSIWIEDHRLKLPAAVVKYTPMSSDILGGAFDSENRLYSIDQLNLMYVATTRAENRLYMSCSLDAIKAEKDDLLNQTHRVLVSSEMRKENDDREFHLGKCEPNRRGSEKQEDDGLLLSFPSVDWQDNLKISFQANQKIDSEELSEKEFGLQLHDLLAFCSSTEEASSRLESKILRGELDERTKDKLMRAYEDVHRWSEVSEWLMPGNKNRTEQAIIGPDGQQLIPDRVVYFKDRIDVLDFKTGNPHENHHKQVMKYVNAIQSMESLPVRGYLIYTNKRVLERVV